jgi:hypothetical protein
MGIVKKAMGALGFGDKSKQSKSGSPHGSATVSAVVPLGGSSPNSQELPADFHLTFNSVESFGDDSKSWAQPPYRGSGDGRALPGSSTAAIRAMYGPLDSPGPSTSGTPHGELQRLQRKKAWSGWLS